MHHVRLDHAVFQYDRDDPAGYRSGAARLGAELEAQEMVVKAYEIPPGESLCPYHYEYAEEWLLVLSGQLVVRVPEGAENVAEGSLVRFPAGPEGAHKFTNHGELPARVLMWSSSREPAVSVYPDSDKLGVWPGDEHDSVMLRRSDGRVPYYEGEA
jgi:uncharacterized cupin superfamily protein